MRELFGLANVGASFQQFGRETGGNFRRESLLEQRRLTENRAGVAAKQDIDLIFFHDHAAVESAASAREVSSLDTTPPSRRWLKTRSVSPKELVVRRAISSSSSSSSNSKYASATSPMSESMMSRRASVFR